MYVAEITQWRIQKITLHPQTTRATGGR